MTQNEAQQLAWSAICNSWSITEDEPILVGQAQEEDFGWVFCYTSKRYHETNEIRYAIAGNGPVVVSRESGIVTQLGTAGRFKKQIEDYRNRKGAPQ